MRFPGASWLMAAAVPKRLRCTRSDRLAGPPRIVRGNPDLGMRQDFHQGTGQAIDVDLLVDALADQDDLLGAVSVRRPAGGTDPVPAQNPTSRPHAQTGP